MLGSEEVQAFWRAAGLSAADVAGLATSSSPACTDPACIDLSAIPFVRSNDCMCDARALVDLADAAGDGAARFRDAALGCAALAAGLTWFLMKGAYWRGLAAGGRPG